MEQLVLQSNWKYSNYDDFLVIDLDFDLNEQTKLVLCEYIQKILDHQFGDKLTYEGTNIKYHLSMTDLNNILDFKIGAYEYLGEYLGTSEIIGGGYLFPIAIRCTKRKRDAISLKSIVS